MALSTTPLRGKAFVNMTNSYCFLYGLDRLAVYANALNEGMSGDVGDDGTAYGPWQDHMTDGRLPQFAGRDPYDVEVNWWAWSQAGIQYVLHQMSLAGASNKHGLNAVAVIVRNFEKPADIAGAIFTRQETYQNLVRRGNDVWDYLAEHAGGAHTGIAAQPIAAKAVDDAAAHRPNQAWVNLLRFFAFEYPHHYSEIGRIAHRLPGLVK